MICPKCRLPLSTDHTHRTYEEHDACRNRIYARETTPPFIRRVHHDLYFVEWGNVRMGGTFSELATFAAELQAGMTKSLAGDPEDKRKL